MINVKKELLHLQPAAEVYDEADVAVTGGGPAGTAAAISAARCGQKVILLEQSGQHGFSFQPEGEPCSVKQGRPYLYLSLIHAKLPCFISTSIQSSNKSERIDQEIKRAGRLYSLISLNLRAYASEA
ncbi:FAD-dependent oxidoreductase [Paenibacillus sp. S150]|uniref:FAD-dependent oxidoreductase n=1 Tax=Paenibacillus sp. S150 TaxID=2749826 RepID=UPI001C59E20E|nr:FAD-dependent oxidoreductase [Paenibacillus sp. S150]MBW4079844.1 FAD-dependent oxidoreductase [Paenibacillus sp. S150]